MGGKKGNKGSRGGGGRNNPGTNPNARGKDTRQTTSPGQGNNTNNNTNNNNNKTTNTTKKNTGGNQKKDSKITQRNIQRFGEAHVRSLQEKQRDFKAVQRKEMARSTFASKHYGKGYGNTGNVGRSLQRRPETDAELARIAANQAASRERDARIAAEQAASRERDRQRAAAKAEAERQAKLKQQRMFDPNRLDNQLGLTTAQAFSNVTTANRLAPTGGISSWYNKGRLPNEGKMSIRQLAANDLRQQQQIGKFDPKKTLNLASYARGESNPFRGMPGYGTLTGQGEVPGGFQTGPTPSVRQALERPLRFGLGLLTNPKAALLAAVSAPTPLADGTMDAARRREEQMSGGLNIGGTSPQTEGGEAEKGSRTGRTIGSRLLGGVDAVFGTDLDNLGGRTTPFGQQLTSSINAFNTANQNIGELTGSTNTAKNLAGSLMLGRNVSMEDLARTTEAAKRFKEDGVATGFKSLTPQTTESIGDVYNALESGRLTNPLTGNDVYKQAMTNFGGENFQGAIRENVNYFTQKYGQLTDDPNQNRKVVSDMLIAKDPRLDSLKALGYQMKENPDIGIQQQVKNALQPDAKQLKGINRQEMGVIGSLGNFILSNQGRDIVTGNLAGTNNALDLASNIARTGADPLSDTYRASQGFLTTIGAGGQPTAGSLIRGILPRGKAGSNRQGVSGTDNVTKFNTATPEELVPQGYNFGADQSGVNPETLSDLQQNAYNTALDSYGVELQQPPIDGGTQFTPEQIRRFSLDPEYFAQFRQRPRRKKTGSFRKAFIRKYF